jgi:N6-adenosine-specific RNA methylase IME4
MDSGTKRERAGPAPFEALKAGHYGAILADPPWRFRTWNNQTAIPRHRSGSHGTYVSAACHYDTMTIDDICALPVRDLAARNCALFMWILWPMLPEALRVIGAWGFSFKTCAFDWTKAHAGQLDMFRDDVDALMGMGYWTRANSEPCLLATRGKPKRLAADVRMGVIEPRREHSRKPDCVHGRIERLVSGPYLELFARRYKPGWTVYGNEVSTELSAEQAERLAQMGPEERRREIIKIEGRVDRNPGPLFR